MCQLLSLGDLEVAEVFHLLVCGFVNTCTLHVYERTVWLVEARVCRVLSTAEHGWSCLEERGMRLTETEPTSTTEHVALCLHLWVGNLATVLQQVHRVGGILWHNKQVGPHIAEEVQQTALDAS